MVPEDRIARVLRESRSSEDACRRLVDYALEAGGSDNVTVIVARYRIPKRGPSGSKDIVRVSARRPASSPDTIPRHFTEAHMRLSRLAAALVLCLAAAELAAQEGSRSSRPTSRPRSSRRGARRLRGDRQPGVRGPPGGARDAGLHPVPAEQRLLLPLRHRGPARVPDPRRLDEEGLALPPAPQREPRARRGQDACRPRTPRRSRSSAGVDNVYATDLLGEQIMGPSSCGAA
jgi:hypothetical protein